MISYKKSIMNSFISIFCNKYQLIIKTNKEGYLKIKELSEKIAFIRNQIPKTKNLKRKVCNIMTNSKKIVS